MVQKRIFSTRRLAMMELKRRRKRKDFKSGVFKINDKKFVVGTSTQARNTI